MALVERGIDLAVLQHVEPTLDERGASMSMLLQEVDAVRAQLEAEKESSEGKYH